MGMILYTKSGTFVPSDHGLNVGDAIHIRVVGGGAVELVQPVAHLRPLVMLVQRAALAAF